jgi:hypothetical protein
MTWQRWNRDGKIASEKREPLYTLSEIADRLNMDEDALYALMRSRRKAGATPPPTAKRRVGSAMQMRTKLYALSEFKVWLKQRLNHEKN